jgi:hypothetical protein
MAFSDVLLILAVPFAATLLPVRLALTPRAGGH